MKTVLITGGSRGIGAATACLFSKEGYRVIVNCKESIEEAKKLGFEVITADVSSRAQTEKMFQMSGGVDILINNAGISQQKLFTDITKDDWDNMLGVNLTGVFNCCQCALPYMIQQKSGCIINISSMWGQCGGSCEVHYSATKAGVIGLTKALAKEVGPSGIAVNCIAPGVIDTKMNSNLDSDTLDELKNETPLCKIGTPDDIAKCALYLAKSTFITGQVIGVNGGLVI